MEDLVSDNLVWTFCKRKMNWNAHNILNNVILNKSLMINIVICVPLLLNVFCRIKIFNQTNIHQCLAKLQERKIPKQCCNSWSSEQLNFNKSYKNVFHQEKIKLCKILAQTLSASMRYLEEILLWISISNPQTFLKIERSWIDNI